MLMFFKQTKRICIPDPLFSAASIFKINPNMHLIRYHFSKYLLFSLITNCTIMYQKFFGPKYPHMVLKDVQMRFYISAEKWAGG